MNSLGRKGFGRGLSFGIRHRERERERKRERAEAFIARLEQKSECITNDAQTSEYLTPMF